MNQASRLTFQEVAYHFLPGQVPVALPAARLNKPLSSDEQTWVRRLTVGELWQRVDFGWVERCAFLRVANDEGRDLAKLAGEARDSVLARVVELGWGPEGAQQVQDAVPPGESVRRLPPDPKALWLRCRRGRAAVTVVAVPE